MDTIQHLVDLMNSLSVRVGNVVRSAAGVPTTPSVPLFVDASGNLGASGFPFALQLLAGVTNTSFSVMAVEGSSTGTAADAMHQTLVSGTATSLTTAGFLRVTITDDAGNLTNGAYYIPFGTLA